METLAPLAGKPAPLELLVDVTQLERAYFDTSPDVEDPIVHFGTSGHRGSSLRASFNESHILAITQAICDYGERKTSRVRSTSAWTRTRFPRPKVVTKNGWFAARPSGTENIYKIYAESFRDEAHLEEIVSEAQEIVHHALASTAVKQ